MRAVRAVWCAVWCAGSRWERRPGGWARCRGGAAAAGKALGEPLVVGDGRVSACAHVYVGLCACVPACAGDTPQARRVYYISLYMPRAKSLAERLAVVDLCEVCADVATYVVVCRQGAGGAGAGWR